MNIDHVLGAIQTQFITNRNNTLTSDFNTIKQVNKDGIGLSNWKFRNYIQNNSV